MHGQVHVFLGWGCVSRLGTNVSDAKVVSIDGWCVAMVDGTVNPCLGHRACLPVASFLHACTLHAPNQLDAFCFTAFLVANNDCISF